MIENFRQRYQKQGLWALFLVCVIPQHAWGLILAFRDASWLSDRTSAWDAIGVMSYALLFAVFESLVVFVVMVLLGYLVSVKWERGTRIALLASMVIVLSLWGILKQLYFLLKLDLPGSWVDFLIWTGHPLRIAPAVILLTVGLSFLVPALLVVRSNRAYRFTEGVIQRLSLLAVLYLFLDVVALVIVVIRNV